MPLSGPPASNDNPAAAYPSRRELRAQRAAAVTGTPAAGTPGAGALVARTTTRIAVPARPALSRTHAAAAHAPPAHAAPASKGSTPRGRRPRGKNPLTAFITLLAIPGLFLTTALPAYAFAPNEALAANRASAAHSRTTAEAQGINVAATASTVGIARDSFTATTPEELAARAAAAKRATDAGAARASSAQSSVRGIRAEGDDYPWPDETTYAEGGPVSPLGYYYRECVDFVAWRLNRDAGSTGGSWRWTNASTGAGSAYSWANAWKSHGLTTSNTPVVGAVAWFKYNHVAYVQSIPGNGKVVLEEYNWMGNHSYHKRTVAIDEVELYLYPPS